MLEPTGANFGVGREKRGVEKSFGGREGTRFVVEQTSDGVGDRRVESVRFDERLNESDVGGARGGEGRGGQNELLKRGERKFSAQKREEKARRKTAFRFGEDGAEGRVGDDEVASGNESGSSAASRAANRRDDRLRRQTDLAQKFQHKARRDLETRESRRKVGGKERCERLRGEVERLGAAVGVRGDVGFDGANAKIVEVERVGSERFERNRRAVRRFVEVEAGAKMSAGAAQDDESRRIVGGDLAQFDEKAAQQLERKRVATLRAVQRQRRDAAFVVGSR